MTDRLRRIPRLRRLLLGVAISISVTTMGGLPSPARAATTIGSDLAAAPSIGSGHALGLTSVLRAFPGRQVTAPADGVIVTWRIRVGAFSNAQLVELRVIRGTGAASTGAGSSQAETVPAAPGIYTFAAALPIAAGDFIGIDVLPSSTTGTYFGAGPPGTQRENWVPPLADGESRAPNSSNAGGVAINADIEPDCDADGLGDETQDLDISTCNPPAPKSDRTLTLDANKGKVEKGRKVRLSGQIDAPQNEAGCEPNQTVELQRKAKNAPDTAFATFRTVQTDQAGNFADKVKVKKTRIYRGVVPETEACDDELSNTQKVRVQQKKAAQEA
jgi:hypothetical protein